MPRAIERRLQRLEETNRLQGAGLAIVLTTGLDDTQIAQEVARRAASLPVGYPVIIVDR